MEVCFESSSEDDGSRNIIDPVRLLLIYALRLGVVAATSWRNILQQTITSPGGNVQWTTPSSPVLFGLASRSTRVVLTRAAPTNQQLRILRDAANLIGMIVPPITHDLRRGAAKDLSALSQTIHNETAARRGLGHSHRTANAGATDRYVGSGMTDTWDLRVRNAKSDDPFGPEMGITPFKRPMRKPREIDEWCEKKSLDKTKRYDRLRASRSMEKKHREDWVKEQRTALAHPRSPPVEKSPVKKTPITTTECQCEHGGHQTVVHLFTACMDPRSRPLRELGLHAAESVGETLGDPKRAPEMARRLVGSGWLPEYRVAETLRHRADFEELEKEERRREEEVMEESEDPG